MIAAMLGVLDPGDEVVVFEPFYENYGPDAILVGRRPAVRAAARRRTGRSTRTSSRAAFNARTRGIVDQHAEQPDRQGVHARGARR